MLGGFLSVLVKDPSGANRRAGGLKGMPRKHSPARMSRANTGRNWFALFAQVELLEGDLVAVRGRLLEVIEHLPAAGHHLEQAAARGVILQVCLEVLGELIDAAREQGDLHIGAAGVFFVHSQRLNILSIGHNVFFVLVVLWGAKYVRESRDGKELFRIFPERGVIKSGADNAVQFTTQNGNVSTASIGAIQRNLLNILAADRLVANPPAPAARLIWPPRRFGEE